MSFTTQEFPNTSFYDSDLRDVLTYMREFEKTLDSYSDVASKLEEALNSTIPDLESRVTAIEAVIGDLVTIKTRLTTLETGLYNLTQKEAADVANLQSQITALKTTVDNWTTQIEEITTYFNMQLDRIEGNFNQKIRDLTVLINTINEDLGSQIKILSERLEYILKNLSYDVFNPAVGERITFDENNKDIYYDLNDAGISFGELANRQYTYDYIASGKWTFREVFTKGRELIARFPYALHSPLTGLWETWSQAMSGMLGFVYNSKSYQEFADLDYTFDALEELDLTYQDIIKLV